MCHLPLTTLECLKMNIYLYITILCRVFHTSHIRICQQMFFRHFRDHMVWGSLYVQIKAFDRALVIRRIRHIKMVSKNALFCLFLLERTVCRYESTKVFLLEWFTFNNDNPQLMLLNLMFQPVLLEFVSLTELLALVSSIETTWSPPRRKQVLGRHLSWLLHRFPKIFHIETL